MVEAVSKNKYNDRNIIIFYYCYQMTEAQLTAAGKLIRNMCQPKSKVTDGKLKFFGK